MTPFDPPTPQHPIDVAPAPAIRLRELAIVAALFAAVTLLYMAPLFRDLAAGLPENSDDARRNAWLLAWGADRLPHGLRGFWSPPILYPYEHALAQTENLLGISVLVAPVQWLFRNPTLSYNAALLMSFVIAGIGMYMLARELTGRRDAALLAACAFAFAPYRWGQLSHLQVLMTGWMPLALWGLHRWLRAPSWAVAAAFASAVLLQIFSNGYAAFQLALALTIAGAWSIAASRIVWTRIGKVIVGVGLMAALVAPAIIAYADVWKATSATTAELRSYSADLGTYLDVAPGLPHHRWLPGVPQDEGHLFPGVVVSVMAAIAVLPVAGRLRWRWLYAAIGVLGLMISLGPAPRAWGRLIPAPPVYSWLLATVPLFGALRVPARFGMLVVLACAVLAAIGTAKIVAPLRPSRARAVVAALCAIVLWEGYGGPLRVVPNLRAEGAWDAESYRWLAQQPAGAVLHLPFPHQDRARRELEYQFATLVHRHPTVNGIGRFETPLQFVLEGSASPFFEPDMQAEAVPFLRGLGVRYALVRYADFADATLRARAQQSLEESDDARVIARFGDLTVYEISAAPARADVARLTPIASSSFRLSASHRPDRLAMLVDGNLDSRWHSAVPEDGTEWISVEFDRPRDVARVDFQYSSQSLNGFPRRLQIASGGSPTGEPETVLYDGGLLEALGRGLVQSPDHPVASVELPRARSTRLFIRQLGRAERWFWSIDELTVWERQ